MNESLDLMHSSFNAELQSRHGFKLFFCKKISIFFYLCRKNSRKKFANFRKVVLEKPTEKRDIFGFRFFLNFFRFGKKNSFRSRIYVSSSKTRFERNFQLEARYGSGKNCKIIPGMFCSTTPSVVV